MSADIATLGLRIDARQIREGERALDEFDRTGGRVDGTVDRLNGTMARLAKMAAAVAAAFSVQELIRQADLWSSLNGRLALVTDSTAAFTRAQNELFKIAQKTRSELEGTVDLYAKLTRATKALGTSDKDRLRVTETINKAMVIGGTGANEQANAIRQLGQAFASGVLRGDEFNSVLEASPRLIEAIGAGMGRTSGEMRAMAEQGKLTSRAIMDALLSQGVAVDEEFAKIPKTVGQAMTQVQNSILRTIGVFDQQNQLSGSLANAMTTLADNVNLVVGAFAGLVATTALNTLASFTATVWRGVAATTADIAAKRAAAAAAVTLAATTVTETAATAALTAARLAELRATVIAAPANERLFLTLTALIPAQQRAAAAAAAHAAALVAQTAATTAAAGVAGLAGRAMAVLGGPIGLVTLALGLGAAAWAAWGTKAKETTEEVKQTIFEETEEMVSSLKKLNAELTERNRLASVVPDLVKAKTPAAEQQLKIMTEINATAKRTDLDSSQRTAILQALGGAYAKLNEQTEQNIKLRKIADAAENASKKGDWIAKNTKYMDDAAKLAAAIATAKKELGDAFDGDVEKMIRDDFARAGNDKSTEKAATAKKAAEDFIKTLQAERLAIGATEEQLAMMEAARAAALAPAGLRESIMANALALLQEGQAYEAAAKSKADSAALDQALFDASMAQQTSARDRVIAMQLEIEQYGLGAAAISRLTLAKLQARQVALETNEGSELEIATNAALIASTEKLIGLQDRKADLDALFDTTKVQSFGDALRDAFGAGGSALGQLGDLMQEFNQKEESATKQRAAAMLKFSGDEVRQAKEIKKINEAQTRSRVGDLANMATAAKGFFKENSKGYKAMETAEKAFRAAEMAMAIQSMVTKVFATETATAAVVVGKSTEIGMTAAASSADDTATGKSLLNSAKKTVANTWEGISKVFAQMGIWGFVGAAAILAYMGAFGGTGGGGAAASTSEERQKTQGTGTVLGDESAKSESIAKALQAMEDYAALGLGYQVSMLDALRSIESALGGAAKNVLQTAGITGGSAFGTQNSSEQNFFGSDKSTTITDSGVSFKGTLGTLASGFAKGSQYEDVTKTSDGGWFHGNSSSSWTNRKALNSDAMKPFSMIFESLGTVLVDAGVKLGKDGAQLAAQINALPIDFSVSLRNLKGDELADALSAGVSVAFDKLTATVFPMIEQFRKVGEGLGETLVRVAADVMAVDSVFTAMGKSYASLTIETKEMLVEAAGGLDKFAASAASFMQNFYSDAEQRAMTAARLQPVLNKFGLSTEGPNAQKMFKDFVLGLDTSTAAGRAAYAMLMDVQQAFKDVTDAAAEQRTDLLDQIDELVMTRAQLLAKERLTYEPSNRALFDHLKALEAANEAQELARESLGGLIEDLRAFAETVTDFSKSLLVGSLSPLTQDEQYAELRRQYERTAALAMTGDEGAQKEYTGIAQAFLTASQKRNGGDAMYSKDFAAVLAMNDKLAQFTTSRADAAVLQLALAERQANGIDLLNETLARIEAQNAPVSATNAPGSVQDQVNRDAAAAAIAAELQAVREELAATRVDNARLAALSAEAAAKTALANARKIVEGVGGAILATPRRDTKELAR